MQAMIDYLHPATFEIGGVAGCHSGTTTPCNSCDHHIKLRDGKARCAAGGHDLRKLASGFVIE
jgi:hypothetical protein